MSEGMKTIIYPVKNIAKSTELFSSLLGVAPYVDQPYYVAFNAGGHDIGLDPNGHARGMMVSVAFWHVADID